jgi:hypothetical protein
MAKKAVISTKLPPKEVAHGEIFFPMPTNAPVEGAVGTQPRSGLNTSGVAALPLAAEKDFAAAPTWLILG